MPNERAVSALRAVLLAGEQYRQAVSQYYGTGVTESLAMSYLLRDGSLGQSELGARRGRTTGAVTALVDRLERAGFARRQAHPTDRRRSLVVLTVRGEAAMAESRQWFDQAFDGIDPADLEPTITALERISKRLEEQTTRVRCSVPKR